ncbi:MAG: hypothetical protein WC055_00700 [Melioribacteraceae bacterium]
MELKPEVDSKIDLYNLHIESQNISHTITLYDHEWHEYNKASNKLEAQIKNIEDSLKVLRLQLFVKAKQEQEKVTDKAADATAYNNPEYIEMFEQLVHKRLEYADAKTNADLFQNFHYSLLDKSKQIDLLFKMWSAQYFSTDRAGGSNEQPIKQETTSPTKQPNRTLKRREK